MRDGEGLVGVDSAPVLGAHQVRVHIEGVGLATPPIARVPISVSAVTGVQSGGHGVLVTLPGIVLGAPDVVTQVGITVVVSIISAWTGNGSKSV